MVLGGVIRADQFCLGLAVEVAQTRTADKAGQRILGTLAMFSFGTEGGESRGRPARPQRLCVSFDNNGRPLQECSSNVGADSAPTPAADMPSLPTKQETTRR